MIDKAMDVQREKQILHALYFLAERAKNGAYFGYEEAEILESIIIQLSSSVSDKERFGESRGE